MRPGSRVIRRLGAGALAVIPPASSGRTPRGAIAQTINDNFLVVVMLETLESIINADEIASTFGLDVVIQGNSDLSQFSGWNQSDARYNHLLTISRNATLKAGKYWGNAGAQYLEGHPLSADTLFVQNGPSNDGFAFPQRGRGAAEAPEPTVGGAGRTWTTEVVDSRKSTVASRSRKRSLVESQGAR